MRNLLCRLNWHDDRNFVELEQKIVGSEVRVKYLQFYVECVRCGRRSEEGRASIFKPVNVLILCATVLLFFSVTYL